MSGRTFDNYLSTAFVGDTITGLTLEGIKRKIGLIYGYFSYRDEEFWYEVTVCYHYLGNRLGVFVTRKCSITESVDTEYGKRYVFKNINLLRKAIKALTIVSKEIGVENVVTKISSSNNTSRDLRCRSRSSNTDYKSPDADVLPKETPFYRIQGVSLRVSCRECGYSTTRQVVSLDESEYL